MRKELDVLPSPDKLLAARETLRPEVTARRGDETRWIDVTEAADQDRLLQATYDLLVFIEKAKTADRSTGMQREYPTREDYERDARITLIGWDHNNEPVPVREELQRTYATFKNAGKARITLATGRWRDTGHTGPLELLGQTSEYFNGAMLGGEKWEHTWNDAWIKGAINHDIIFNVASVYKSPTREVRLQASYIRPLLTKPFRRSPKTGIRPLALRATSATTNPK